MQARLQRANTLFRLGKLKEATKDFEVLSNSASGSVKEDAIVQVRGLLIQFCSEKCNSVNSIKLVYFTKRRKSGHSSSSYAMSQ